MRDQVFISYSHQDAQFLRQLETQLGVLEQHRGLEVWSDHKRLEAGDRWRDQIDAALARAKVAVLLVSPDFLASAFIRDNELPPLLAAAQNEGVRIVWVPVRPSLVHQTPLAELQAAWPADRPLSELSKPKREKAWVEICERILQAAEGGAPTPTAGGEALSRSRRVSRVLAGGALGLIAIVSIVGSLRLLAFLKTGQAASGLERELTVIVKNVLGDAVDGLGVGLEGIGEWRSTDASGQASIRLAAVQGRRRAPAGDQWVTLQLEPQTGPREAQWVLLSPLDGRILLPRETAPVTVVVVPWGDRAQLLESSVGRVSAREEILTRLERLEGALHKERELTHEEKQGEVAEVAARFGVAADAVEEAIRIGDHDDSYERGLAALYAEDFPTAQKALAASLEQALLETDEARDRVIASARFLGLAYRRGHRFEDAVEAYRLALELRPTDPDLLFSLGDVSIDTGDYGTAQSCFEKARDLWVAERGPNDSRTLAALYGLAETFWEQGHGERARALFEQVFERRWISLGPEHPETLIAMSDLASIHAAQGDFATAQRLFRQATETMQRVAGAEHPDTLRLMNKAANALREEGRLAEARSLQERVLKVRRQVLGDEHPDTLTSMNDLALTLWREGDFRRARSLQERVLEGREKLFGPVHTATLIAMDNLANTLHDQGDLAGARKLQERALETMQRFLGAGHPDTIATAANLLETVLEQGDVAAGGRLLYDLSRGLEGDPSELSLHNRNLRDWLLAIRREYPAAAAAADRLGT